MSADHARYFLKSLAKGMHVLETLAKSGEPLPLAELSRRAGTNNATVTRICFTLSELGFIIRDRQRRFLLTPKLLYLGNASISSLGWRQVAQHYLEKLAQQTGETVNLSILQGNELMYLVRINNTGRILPFDLQLGSRLPLHCTSMGKSLLAFLNKDELDRILDGYEFNRITHRTLKNEREFLKELGRVRKQGYSVNDEELSVGLRSVAVPIKDSEGHALAALNIAVPTRRVSRRDLVERLAPLAMATAREIQRALSSMKTGQT
ncbi:IclR family transcriptional regulator [Dethiosulfatarculus sandiegensis]|uniref:IclR family transcriptional regulator n=1 Tax=Dethiosulfatarculus sandiegensis TaxID=1429043 RepID=A0A0D2GLK1_9BACT|nr:IclR family transcriptional regulator C-terminal domain-containing protein [Dethiosulfatarculus sandiegensis]KIX15517.1 IclR family transcriptional regulator [Dethiosulfatarculus sandiegensis]